jgi:hypothetical protein
MTTSTDVGQADAFLDEEVWTTLVDRVNEGLCTPFLGPELLRPDELDPSRIATVWTGQEKLPFHDSRNLPRVAEYLAVVKGDTYTPKKGIREIFAPLKLAGAHSRRAFDLLAQLPFPLYVCTYYDDLMIQALADGGNGFPRRARSKTFRWRNELKDRPGAAERRFDGEFEFSAATPVVFHWYGHVDHPQSLVVTERDHLDFLHHFSANPGLVPWSIDEALGRTYLLFLGYSLFELSFQILLRALKERILNNPFRKRHLAVQFTDVGRNQTSEKVEEYLRGYLHQEEIKVVLGDSTGFISELHRRVRASGK